MCSLNHIMMQKYHLLFIICVVFLMVGTFNLSLTLSKKFPENVHEGVKCLLNEWGQCKAMKGKQ